MLWNDVLCVYFKNLKPHTHARTCTVWAERKSALCYSRWYI